MANQSISVIVDEHRHRELSRISDTRFIVHSLLHQSIDSLRFQNRREYRKYF